MFALHYPKVQNRKPEPPHLAGRRIENHRTDYHELFLYIIDVAGPPSRWGCRRSLWRVFHRSRDVQCQRLFGRLQLRSEPRRDVARGPSHGNWAPACGHRVRDSADCRDQSCSCGLSCTLVAWGFSCSKLFSERRPKFVWIPPATTTSATTTSPTSEFLTAEHARNRPGGPGAPGSIPEVTPGSLDSRFPVLLRIGP